MLTRFVKFLKAKPRRPIYLTEICVALGVAERTLRASCEEHLGMGPIRYLTLRRMHLVRAHSSMATVTQIVTDHVLLGVWALLGCVPHAVRKVAVGDIASAHLAM